MESISVGILFYFSVNHSSYTGFFLDKDATIWKVSVVNFIKFFIWNNVRLLYFMSSQTTKTWMDVLFFSCVFVRSVNIGSLNGQGVLPCLAVCISHTTVEDRSSQLVAITELLLSTRAWAKVWGGRGHEVSLNGANLNPILQLLGCWGLYEATPHKRLPHQHCHGHVFAFESVGSYVNVCGLLSLVLVTSRI